MHERSLMRDLVGKVCAVAAEQRARRVTAVRVWCGALSHMTPEHFAEHYREAAAGTLAAGAELHAECDDDERHPHADAVLLRSVEVEDGG